MKILFLTRRYAPSIGGVETHLSHINRILKKQHQIAVVTEQFTEDLPLKEVIEEIDVRRIPLKGGKTSKRAIWGWLLRHLPLVFAADVIHIHDVFFWMLPFRWLFFWKKFYITFHGYEAPGPITKMQIFWHRLAAWWSQLNLCIGEYHRKWYGVKPWAVSYGGVEKLQLAQQVKLTHRKKRLLFAGRLASDTGIMAYLKAFAELKEKQSFQFDVYGDGPLREECEQFALQHNISVLFHGFVPHVTKQFELADIICASQYLSILQALSLNRPVIAYTDTPIKQDYLEMTPFRTGIMLTKNEAEIAAAIREPKSVNKKVVKWAQDQTWQKVAQLYEKMWE